MKKSSVGRWVIPILLMVPLTGACAPDDEPGSSGEECNYDAPGDGCDATSICLNSICHELCSDASDCGGGECATWTSYLYPGGIRACDNATPGGREPGGGGSCDADRQQACNDLVSQCAANSFSQAPCYCAAACECACAGDPCEQPNRQSAASLGTTCSY
jgi:hypothetical protein